MSFHKIKKKRLVLAMAGLPFIVFSASGNAETDTQTEANKAQSVSANADKSISHAKPGVEETIEVTAAANDAPPESGFAPTYTDVGVYQGRDMLDVPNSVSVVSSEIIKAQQGQGLYDALRNVAGVVRQQQSGVAYDQLSIRGINLDNRASYMFNGVLPFDNNLPIPMEDKERFEVLKGASALYYGFVSPGGVVNMVTKRAGSTPVRAVTFSTNDNGSSLAHVDLADRFGDEKNFGVRINAMSNNIHLPIEGDHGNKRFFSAALDWQVNDKLLLKYDYEKVKARITEQAAIATPTAVNGIVTMPNIPDPKKLLSMNGKATKSEAETHLLQAEYVFNYDWSGKMTLGQSRTKRDRWLWVFDSYNANTGNGTVYGADQPGQDYLNQNVRAEVKGNFSTGSVEHQLLVGGSQNRLYQPSFYTTMYSAAQNMYDPVMVTSLVRSPTGSKNTLRDRGFKEQTVRDGGLFLQDWITLNDQWQVTGALRWGRYTSKQLDADSEKVKALTPAVSVVYKVTPDVSLYASYVEGLESAGTAPSTAANAGESLKAVVSKQKEVGVRTRLTDGLFATAAYFELTQPSASTGDDDIYSINGEARYRGGEFSLQGDLTANTSITTSLMLLDAEVTSSTNSALVGKAPENTPEKVANFFINRNLDLLPGVAVNAGASYVGKRPVNSLNQAYVSSYTVYNLGASYKTRLANTDATFRFTVNNVTDKRYWSAAGSGQLAVGMARTFVLYSSFEF